MGLIPKPVGADGAGGKRSKRTGDAGEVVVTLSPFLLLDHEVTNTEYWRFDPAHEPAAPGSQPATRISWYQAYTYAAWLGARQGELCHAQHGIGTLLGRDGAEPLLERVEGIFSPAQVAQEL